MNFPGVSLSAATNGISTKLFQQQRASLPVAGSRLGWPRAQYPHAESAQPARGKTLFPQALQVLALRSTGASHRQTEELRRSEGANRAECRASPAQRSDQPSRTLAPTDAAMRDRQMRRVKSPGHAQRFLFESFAPAPQLMPVFCGQACA